MNLEPRKSNHSPRKREIPCGGLQQRLRGAAAEGADHFGADRGELAHQERRAGGDFVLFGQAIFGRAAFHDVADVDIFAAQAHGFDHLREQFAGAADERLALHVFVAARGLRRRKTRSAFGFPTPKTIFVRPLCSLQRVQLAPMASRMRSSVSSSMRSSKSDAAGGNLDHRLGGYGLLRCAASTWSWERAATGARADRHCKRRGIARRAR